MRHATFDIVRFWFQLFPIVNFFLFALVILHCFNTVFPVLFSSFSLGAKYFCPVLSRCSSQFAQPHNPMPLDELKTSDVKEIKKHLIATKVSEQTNRHDFAALFITLYDKLSTTNTSGSDTVVVIDSLAIWFVRAKQVCRVQNKQFTQSDCSQQQLDRIFLFVCDCLELKTGPLLNALTSLLARLCQFLECVENLDVNGTYTSWVSQTLRLPMTLKSYYVILDTLCKESDSVPGKLLKIFPEFPKECVKVLEYGAIANVASKLFASVVLKVHGCDVSGFGKYKEVVIQGLINPATRASVASNLLPILFRGNPETYKKLLGDIQEMNVDEGIFLAAARVGHIIVPNFEEFEDFEKILHTLSSANPIERLDALEIIVGCVKSSRATSNAILDYLLKPQTLETFFRESRTPQLRNKFATSFRKFVLSLRDFIIKCEKQLAANPEDIRTGVSKEKTHYALTRIFEFALNNLSPCSSYCQLVVATDLIQVFIDHEFDGVERGKKKGNKSSTKVFEIYTYNFIQVVLRTTANNYEDIRQKATNIILLCPYRLFEESMPENYQTYLTNTMKLLTSIKGRQSDSAAQVFLTLAKVFETHDLGKYEDLLKSLHSGLVKASSSGSYTHGYFTAFTYILASANDSAFLGKFGFFHTLISSLLELIKTTWEGSKSLKYLKVADESDAWRIVRESCGLLDIILRVNHAQAYAFFDQNELLSLCKLLKDQLVNVSHRGAFSAIHTAFVEACRICLEVGLKSKLSEWLDENLELIKTHNQLISRRSGGLPSLITAILSGMKSDSDFLDNQISFAFGELLSIASQPYLFDGTETMDIPQVHAFNCMKLIISESVSTAALDKYISAALELSLKNLDHESWSLKNGAVMLFTAIQIRIFGSNMMGDVVVRTNAPVFFLKYPGLSQILIDKLENSGEKVDVIIPVLSILSKLASHKPDDERVKAFLDVLESQYLGHKVWKVREMTALVIATLSHRSLIPERIERYITSLSAPISNNYAHGVLLCIASMYTVVSSSNSRCDTFKLVDDGLRTYFVHLSECVNLDWALLFAASKAIRSDMVSVQTVDVLSRFLSQHLQAVTHSPNSTRRLCLKTIADLLIQVDLQSGDLSSMLERTQQLFKNHNEYEVIISYLEFWTSQSSVPGSIFDARLIVKDAQALLAGLVSSETWPYLSAKIMDFLADVGIESEIEIPKFVSIDASSSIFELTVRNPSHAISLDDVRTLELFARDDQEDKERLASVRAAQCILSKTENTAFQLKALRVLLSKLFDTSYEVRYASASFLASRFELPNTEVVSVSNQILPKLRDIYGAGLILFLIEELNTIEQNLADAVEDVNSTHFEVESDNLYMDEVAYHELIVTELSKFGENSEIMDFVLVQLSEVARQILKNFRLVVLTWTFNRHLEAAISKAIILARFFGENEEIARKGNELHDNLKTIGYPTKF